MKKKPASRLPQTPTAIASSVDGDTPEFRASQHPAVSYAHISQTDTGTVSANFSVASGGRECFVTIEGDGELREDVSVRSDDADIGFQTVRMGGRWLAMGILPISQNWWTPLTVALDSPEVSHADPTVRITTRRNTSASSMVDQSFLPVRQAQCRLPDRKPRHEASILEAIDEALDSGDVDEAVKLTIAALALGLDEVKNSHGTRVLKAAAENADFTVSNDGLKLFIAMSS